MKTLKQYSSFALVSILFLLSIFAVGCGGGSGNATAATVTPIAISTTPIDGATGVALNASIVAIPEVALDSATVTATTFTLKNGATAVAGVVTYVSGAMVFKPDSNLAVSTVYTATITTGVHKADGTAILATNMVWSFTTGVAADSTSPTVVSTNPANADVSVPLDRSVSAIFSEALDPATTDTTSFTLTVGGVPVAGVVSYANKTMTFNPTANFTASTVYVATITTAVKDLAGNALAVSEVWSFTSGTAIATVLTPVNLGTAGNFAVLAKTGVSTGGGTVVGNIGASPVATTFLTGFSLVMDATNVFATSSLVTGKLYAADMAVPTPTNMTTAISDMQIAYTDAAGRVTPDYTNLGAGDISGKILAPGLYKWTTAVTMDNTGVTISGSATDVWIFQISGDLTLASGAIVTLAGGALAKNIFWQVAGGTGLTLGTTSQFKGIVLAQTAITANTGSSVNGRLLSQTAVTLTTSTVTKPAL